MTKPEIRNSNIRNNCRNPHSRNNWHKPDPRPRNNCWNRQQRDVLAKARCLTSLALHLDPKPVNPFGWNVEPKKTRNPRREEQYRSDSPIRNSASLRPYSRTMPRALLNPKGGGGSFSCARHPYRSTSLIMHLSTPQPTTRNSQ